MPIDKIHVKSAAPAIKKYPNAQPLYYDTTTDLLKFYDDNGSTQRSVVTTDQTQTLTNKTLTGATLTGSTVAGGVSFTVRSPAQNVDNGAGTTVDHVIFVPQAAGVVTGARLVYTEEAAGTIAAGTWQVGTTVAGAQIVAAVAYTNAAAVGTETVGTIVSGAITAGTPIIFRHTGVAAVAAGVVYVEIDFDYNG